MPVIKAIWEESGESVGLWGIRVCMGNLTEMYFRSIIVGGKPTGVLGMPGRGATGVCWRAHRALHCEAHTHTTLEGIYGAENKGSTGVYSQTGIHICL